MMRIDGLTGRIELKIQFTTPTDVAGTVKATAFHENITGNVTGNITGTARPTTLQLQQTILQMRKIHLVSAQQVT